MVAVLGALVLPLPSAAQTFDHAACRPIVGDVAGDAETSRGAEGADTLAPASGRKIHIDALDDRFDARGCKVKRARLECGARTRTSLDPAQPLAYVEGDEAADTMICYRVRCRRSAARADVASDAFGARRIGRLRSQLLCIPAV